MKLFALLLLVSFGPLASRAQLPDAPSPAPADIRGVVIDHDGAFIPNAIVLVEDTAGLTVASTLTTDDGSFHLLGLRPTGPYTVHVAAEGFASWASASFSVTRGQHLDLPGIVLGVSSVVTSVSAITVSELATEQVEHEESQRIVAIIPNFWVAYDHNTVPMQASLKLKLAARAELDPVTFAGAGILAALNQAGRTPAYQLGAKGYAQRYGAADAGGASDTFLANGVFAALFHQDPRYFYSGMGSKRKRILYAIESGILCRGDNGNRQFNFAAFAGDLSAAALTNAYYPPQDRGAHLLLPVVGLQFAGRVGNDLVEEFLLRHFTTHAHEAASTTP